MFWYKDPILWGFVFMAMFVLEVQITEGNLLKDPKGKWRRLIASIVRNITIAIAVYLIVLKLLS